MRGWRYSQCPMRRAALATCGAWACTFPETSASPGDVHSLGHAQPETRTALDAHRLRCARPETHLAGDEHVPPGLADARIRACGSACLFTQDPNEVIAPITRNAINQPHIPFAERHLHSLRQLRLSGPVASGDVGTAAKRQKIENRKRRNGGRIEHATDDTRTLLLLERAPCPHPGFSRYGAKSSATHAMNTCTRRDRFRRCAYTKATGIGSALRSGSTSTNPPRSISGCRPTAGA